MSSTSGLPEAIQEGGAGDSVSVAPRSPKPDVAWAVEVRGLVKRYGTTTAVSGVSFAVEDGEIYALLGPNGAGKTTTLEILEGFRQRDDGYVSVLGLDPGARSSGRQLREQIGLVLQDIAVEPYLTVRETVARNAGYYPAPRDVGEVIGLVGLEEHQRKKVKDLSGGQKRRLDLALGVVGNPRLLFLDEPTTGFDPSARQGAWQVVRDLRDAGTSILLTTHYMEEAQELADRVAVISSGTIVAEGSPGTIGGRDTARARVHFTLPGDFQLSDLPVAPTKAQGRLVTVEVDDPTAMLYDLTSWALHRGTTLPDLVVERPSLEEVYLQLTAASAEAETAEAKSSQAKRSRLLGRSKR